MLFLSRQNSSIPNKFRVTARWPGRPTDERKHTMKASTRSQRRRHLKGEGYILKK
ncbi:hypothetical protein [Candidatus Regiella insecticola]|uniref:hypothetical protein n=1 Tax=Candidatus Regiella insecticola TaxID=138073 RepID=UPI00031B004A|nr:hypothetical protein [Candidatus Regiella insecticola]